MSSQEDLFATQESKKNKVKYDFVVLCDRDDQNPFSLYPTIMFSETEINVKWLESILDDSSRLKSLQTLQRMPGKNLSLFGKIVEGTPKKQRDAMVVTLNDEYRTMMNSCDSQITTLISMASKFPYRLISPKKVRKRVYLLHYHLFLFLRRSFPITVNYSIKKTFSLNN